LILIDAKKRGMTSMNLLAALHPPKEPSQGTTRWLAARDPSTIVSIAE
jgi:hypothetical protein